MRRFPVVAFAACALVLCSCRSNANNVVLASLNRSAKIQLLCADVELLSGNRFIVKSLLPPLICTPDFTFDPAVEAQFLGAVTQIQSGEVAVVNFTRNAIINTNQTIPGVTAVTVGEQPTGLQISPFDSTYAYVTSFSAKSLEAIESVELLEGETTGEPPPQGQADPRTVRFEEGPTDLALHEKARTTLTKNEAGEITGATPEVEYRYLYAALPELGKVAQIEVNAANGELGQPVLLDLGSYNCPLDLVDPPDSDTSDYHRICPKEDDNGEQSPATRVIKTVTTTERCAEGGSAGPRPVSLTIDFGREQGVGAVMEPGQSEDTLGSGTDEDDVLLVADANQPVIHRFKLGPDGATLPLDPIVTGAPTNEIDVTPLVPASSDPDDRAAVERYLYAVSARDSSLLVVDYREEIDGASNPTFGAVLPVLSGISARANEENVESRDRVRFGFANVRAIEVVSPGYQLEDPDGDPNTADVLQVPADDICDPTDETAFSLGTNARNMRGVFLAVSLSNGLMYFLDIYDLNAPCRGGGGNLACTTREAGTDRFASIRRHRRRIDFTPVTFISIDGSPSFQFNAAPGRLDEMTGRANGSDGPGLELVACPPSRLDATNSFIISPMNPVFGEQPVGAELDGLICASSQVWSSFTQRWEARWEGLIPQSEGGLGLFADLSLPLDGGSAGEVLPGNWFQGGDVPFCEIGVLGTQPADAALIGPYPGDRLLITGDLPPSTRDEPNCEKFRELRDNIDNDPVWFPILRAFNNQLEIGESENSGYTLAEVRSCFPQFTEYQIHTQDAYAVTGTQTGFIHRVIPDPAADSDECILDPNRPVDLPTEADPFVDVDTYLTGRAFEGTQFINPLVSFKISLFPEDATVTDTTIALLNFNISNQFRDLVLANAAAVRSLPSSMLFFPEQDQLFFVDLEAGVSRIQFSPLNFAQTLD